MKVETNEALAVNIKVQIFDLDMREIVWPISDDNDNEDPGIWLPKEVADKYSDDQLGRWFLNRYLIDYGNSYEFTVIKGTEKIMIFKRRGREGETA